MNVLDIISRVFKPAADLVDNLHTSTEEKLQQKAKLLEIKAKLLEIQVEFLKEGLAYEQEQLKQRAAIVLAEAKSDSFLTSNWRPITMLTFLALVVADQTGLLAFRLAPQAWTLLQIGLGGYVVGRSAEKVVPTLMKSLKSKEQT
jgi:hypothetical protein